MCVLKRTSERKREGSNSDDGTNQAKENARSSKDDEGNALVKEGMY